MDLKLSRARPSQAALEEASQWLIEFRTGDLDAGGRERFVDWLRRSPDNIQSYLEVSAAWAEIPTQDPEQRINLELLIERSRAEPAVTRLPGTQESTNVTRRASSLPPSRWKWAAVAAGIVLSIAAAFWFFPGYETYVTRVGEQRTIELADGSTVEVNSQSRLRIRLTDQQREVQLMDGEALFHVAKDHSRPFVVSTGDAQVRAIGTQFDVYRQRDRTTVTVIEGKVAVTSAATPSNRAYLVANQQMTVTALADVPRQSMPADASTATAWLQKRLIFNNTPLAQVAEEFNRYNTRSLIIEGEALREVRISGVYSSTDPASLIEFLRNYPAIRVTETARFIRVQRAR